MNANNSVKLGFLARLEAKPEKVGEVENLLKGALDLAQAEQGTIHWFAIRLGPTTFGIFDSFQTEAARQAHITGPIAQALMAKAPELLAKAPEITPVEIFAVKG